MVGLLAAASIVVGYVNTLFTQTVHLAAEDFGISENVVGRSGSLVRLGIIGVLPLLFLADKRGRRKILVPCAIGATICAALGALAPSFGILTLSQAGGRSLGLGLDVLIAVIAAEEMPRNSRAYAVSVLTMATGLGAGLCVMALPLGDISTGSWRLVYVPPLILLVIAVDLARKLPESQRFTLDTPAHPHRLSRSRLAVVALTAFAANIFVAPASFFQNTYLKDIHNYSSSKISAFTLLTATPAGLGLMIGGRIADVRGRRVLGVASLVIGTSLFAISFRSSGAWLWLPRSPGRWSARSARRRCRSTEPSCFRRTDALVPVVSSRLRRCCREVCR